MHPAARVLLKVGGAALWAGACEALRVEPRADEVLYTRTEDGWRLALSRYLPRGATRARHPVVLCHGLSANRIGFDLDPGPSLARTLAANGFDTFALELRGRGLSEQPRLGSGRRYGWDFDAYLRRDIPAGVERVLREVGAARAHWVGHSMGGVLLYAALATGAEWVRSGVTLGSAIDYSGAPSDFRALLRIEGLTRVLPALPFGPFAWVTAPLSGRVHNRVEEFNIWPRNVEPEVARRVNASCFHPVSTPVLLQLRSALEPGGLRSADGRLRYAEGLGQARAPVLALVGTKDRQCHPDAARRTLEQLGSLRKHIRVLGPETGCAEHYGHFDLLCGRRAPSEVFPHILDWLREHD